VHQGHDLFFGREYFVFFEVLFKVLVRNKPVVVLVHLFKDLVELRFRVKNFVLDLDHKRTQFLVCLVIDWLHGLD